MGDVPADGVEACPSRALDQRALRPPFSALGSERGWILPPLEDALARYFAEKQEYEELVEEVA